MTCENCIHYERCKEVFLTDKICWATDCEDFKNKDDFAEVVRCRNCKHFTTGMAVGMCKRLEDKPITPIPYNHFCSFGERKEEER